MVSVKNEESSDSDTISIKKKSRNSAVTPKVELNTQLQKNTLHAASLSAKKDFLSKMLEKSDRIKDLAAISFKNIKTPKNSPTLPLRSILKKPCSKKSDDDFSNDSDTNDNNGAVFTPKFDSTHITEATPKTQKNIQHSESNTNIKEAFKNKMKMNELNKYNNDNSVSKSSPLTSTVRLNSINKKSSNSDSDSDSEEDSDYKRDFPDIGSLDRFREIRGRKREMNDKIDSKSSSEKKSIKTKKDSPGLKHTTHSTNSDSSNEELRIRSKNSKQEEKQSSHSNQILNNKEYLKQLSKNYIEKKRSSAKKNDSASDLEAQRTSGKNANNNQSLAKNLLSLMLTKKNEKKMIKKHYSDSDSDEPKQQVANVKIQNKIDRNNDSSSLSNKEQQKLLKKKLKKSASKSSSSDSDTKMNRSSIITSFKSKQDKSPATTNQKFNFSKNESSSSESEGDKSDKRDSGSKKTNKYNSRKSKKGSSSSESEENESDVNTNNVKQTSSSKTDSRKHKSSSSEPEERFSNSKENLNKKGRVNQTKESDSHDSSSEDNNQKKSKNRIDQGDSSDSNDNSKDNLYLKKLFSNDKHNNERGRSESFSKSKSHNDKNNSRYKHISMEPDLSDASNKDIKKGKSNLRKSLELPRFTNDDSDYYTKNITGVKRKHRSLPENDIKNKRRKMSESSSDSDASNELNRQKSKLKAKAQTPAEQLLLQFETERNDLKRIDITDLDYGFPRKSSDHELFIAKIPKDLRTYLSGAKLSLTATTKINTNEGKLICVPCEVTEDKNELNFFSQENGELNIITTKLCGKLTGYQELETFPEMEISENKKCVALPNNLKQRHPLFGPNYSDKIELKEDIKLKLETSALPMKIKSKKHKKDKQKDIESKDQSFEHNELIFQMLGKSQEHLDDTHSKSSKNSKKEATENMDILEYLNKNVFNNEPEKKKKKSKNKLVESNNDFDFGNNEEKIQKKKRKRENKYEDFSEFDTSDAIKNHKKSKVTMSSDEDSTDGRSSFKVKHKKNKKS